MPAPDQLQRPHLAAMTHQLTCAPAELTLGDVLAAVQSLAERFDRLEAAVKPPESSLMLERDEIARTMALLRIARPLPKETPP